MGATCALSTFVSDTAFAQGPPFQPGHKNHHGRGVREQWMQLPPDERQVFERNAERWLRMTPQEQETLRQRERVRRARIKSEAERSLRRSGLQLDPNSRDLYETRYFQEHRRMERALRREIESKRQQELPALSERLKSEFQVHPGPSTKGASAPANSAASPTHSASPRR